MGKKFSLRCPGCGNRMLYQAQSQILSGKVKRCVYCGRSFQVKDNIVSAGQ